MYKYLLNKLKNNPQLFYFATLVYNILHLNYPLRYVVTGKIKCKGVYFRHTSFDIRGEGSRVELERKTKLHNCSITIHGANCSLHIGGGGKLINTSLWLEDNDSSIIIGSRFTIESGHIASTEGQSIVIGEDCMFSNDIEIRNGDSHAILDTGSNIRTNAARKVIIGNHVWLTAHCRVLKGSVIPDDCVIGNSAIVSGQLEKSHAIYAGHPIKIVKENKTWSRKR